MAEGGQGEKSLCGTSYAKFKPQISWWPRISSTDGAPPSAPNEPPRGPPPPILVNLPRGKAAEACSRMARAATEPSRPSTTATAETGVPWLRPHLGPFGPVWTPFHGPRPPMPAASIGPAPREHGAAPSSGSGAPALMLDCKAADSHTTAHTRLSWAGERTSWSGIAGAAVGRRRTHQPYGWLSKLWSLFGSLL